MLQYMNEQELDEFFENLNRVPDNDELQHWSAIKLQDYHASSGWTYVAYIWEWILALLTVAFYAADTYTAVILIAYNRWPGQIQPAIPFYVSRWLFFACILFSWLLAFYSTFRGFQTLKSHGAVKDYLDPFASTLQSLRSWKRFLVFDYLTKSKKGLVRVALFAHFQFHGAMRTILAEGPRQAINAITLYSVLQTNLLTNDGHGASAGQFFINVRVLAMSQREQAVVLCTMLFTLFIWICSFTTLVIALLTYLFYLSRKIERGNLGRYCTRKMLKRLYVINRAAVKEQYARIHKDQSRRVDLAKEYGKVAAYEEQLTRIEALERAKRLEDQKRRADDEKRQAEAAIDEITPVEQDDSDEASDEEEPPKPIRKMRVARPTSLSTIAASPRSSPSPLRMLMGHRREKVDDVEALLPTVADNEIQHFQPLTPAPLSIPRKPLPSYTSHSVRGRFPINPYPPPSRPMPERPVSRLGHRRDESGRPVSRRGNGRDESSLDRSGLHMGRRPDGAAGVPVPPVSPFTQERGGIGGPTSFEAMGF